MASSSSLATTAKSKVNSSCYPPVCKPHYYLSHSNLSFRLSSPNPFIRLQAKGFQSSWNRSTLVKAQLNEVADGSSNSAATSSSKADSQITEDKDAKSSTEPGPASEEAISEFIAQVKNLVKLVDSRDIVELQLKQLDCELTIRKIEALPQPAAPAPIMMHAPAQPPTFQAASPPAPSAPTGPPPAAAPPALKPARSSHPPLKCPMAGTFYRSPAPGEPSFVKVGDKVQKGQVLCIIEAMKLMNEIELPNSNVMRTSGSSRRPGVSSNREPGIFGTDFDSVRSGATDASPGIVHKNSSTAQRSSPVLYMELHYKFIQISLVEM